MYIIHYYTSYVYTTHLIHIPLYIRIQVAVQDGFKDPFSYDAVQCFAHMVNLSPICRVYVTPELVDAMFRGGLTEELVITLNTIIKHIPHVRNYVQRQLTGSIASVLMKYISTIGEGRNSTSTPSRPQPLVIQRHSSYAVTPKKTSFWSRFNTTINNKTTPELSMTEQLTFAMSVIAKHDFFFTSIDTNSRYDRSSSHSPTHSFVEQYSPTTTKLGPGATAMSLRKVSSIPIMPNPMYEDPNQADPIISLISILRDAVTKYLVDINPVIRSAAAMSCLAVLHKIVIKLPSSHPEQLTVSSILDRLLQLGVGDEHADIRCKIFSSIQSSLDHIVIRAEHIHYLLEALNDEVCI